ncbi:hypothetical protein LIER_43287 [Lithospermum erythrorhizon]|uniref:Uncharacterized protein n=1 Tax=Lithospermum erythrorhizon TaxID=34254 RepID=A0AAV3PT11_LITER
MERGLLTLDLASLLKEGGLLTVVSTSSGTIWHMEFVDWQDKPTPSTLIVPSFVLPNNRFLPKIDIPRDSETTELHVEMSIDVAAAVYLSKKYK